MRAMIALATLAVLAVAAMPASAGERTYNVSFHGHGLYRSSYSVTSTRDFQGQDGHEYTGSCVYERSERTHISWTVPFHVKLDVTPDDVSGATKEGVPVVPGKAPKSVVKTYTHPGEGADGCSDGEGHTVAGSGKCVGRAHTRDTEENLTIGPTGKKSTRLAVTGPDFEGFGFHGLWTFQQGSCGKSNNGRALLLPDDGAARFAMGPSFRVKKRTWRKLKVGHWFRVEVGNGRHVQGGLLRSTCQQHCKHSLRWHGQVRVKRLK